MMRQWTLGALAGLISLATAPAFGAVTINVVGGAPSGGKVTVNVTLSSGGGSVGGMQNDILFDSSVVNLASATACKINAAIGTGEAGCEEDPVVGPCKTLSRNLVNCGTTPSAPGCEGQSATTSRFRGIVAATAVPNTNEIADGAVLYSCEFSIVSEGGLPATLTNTNVVASDPTGGRLEATGTNGTIGSGTPPSPSPTPTTPPVETCTAAICVNVGKVTVSDAGKVTVDVVASGSNLGGAQNDILFDSSKVSLASATACKINAAIGTGDAGCEEDPVVGPCKTLSRNLVNCGTTPSAPGCEGQSANISRFRGIIAATAVPNNNVIPTGSVLYSCEFDATASADLINSNIVASDPFGARLDAGGDDGQICIGDCGTPPTPTPTPEAENTATPTNTAVPPTATNTPANTNTPTVKPTTAVPVATATATKTKSVPATGGDDDDGCNISTSRTNSNAILLLIPALGLLAIRRKRA